MWLFRFPSVAVTRNFLLKIPAVKSLVVVLPLLPVTTMLFKSKFERQEDAMIVKPASESAVRRTPKFSGRPEDASASQRAPIAPFAAASAR